LTGQPPSRGTTFRRSGARSISDQTCGRATRH
jgi:hypothetical protein